MGHYGHVGGGNEVIAVCLVARMISARLLTQALVALMRGFHGGNRYLALCRCCYCVFFYEFCCY